MKSLNKNYLIPIIIAVPMLSMKTYPMIITTIGGRDTWIAVIVATILLLIFSLLVIKAFKANNHDDDLKNMYCNSLGKPLGTLFIILFAICLILTLIECSSVEANLLHVNILFETPQWYFIIFFLLPTLYTVYKGEGAILSVTLIGIPLIMLSGINLSSLLIKYRHASYLLPILKNGFDKNLLICSLKTFAMYSGFGILFPIINKVKQKNKLAKPILIGLAILGEIQIFATIGLLMTFSEKRLNSMYYPRLIQTQLINYFDFIESGEFYVLFQVVGGWFIKYILTFYALQILLKYSKFDKKYTIYIISAIVFIASYFLSKNTVLLFKALNYYTYISFANFIVLPAIVFIFYILRSRNKKA